MILTLIAVLFLLWLLGVFAIHITAWGVHLLLVAAFIVFVFWAVGALRNV